MFNARDAVYNPKSMSSIHKRIRNPSANSVRMLVEDDQTCQCMPFPVKLQGFRVDRQLGIFQSTLYSEKYSKSDPAQGLKLPSVFDSFIRRVESSVPFDFSFKRFKTASKSSGELRRPWPRSSDVERILPF